MNAGIRIVVADDEVGLAISAASDAARRDLGAVAWSVLETLALAGHDVDGRWVATTNVRDLGRRLGIGKDRAAAALKLLRDSGLITARTSRDDKTARFAASSYEVCLPGSTNTDTRPIERATEPPNSQRAPRRRRTPPTETLDLFASIS